MTRLALASGGLFATGQCRFTPRLAAVEDRLTRVFVQLQIGDVTTSAVLDTGGVYLVLSPLVGEALSLDRAESLGTDRLVVRGFVMKGTIHRVGVTFPAVHGSSLTFEATAFLPELAPGEDWPLPSFLGWQGCLERIRFAVDPADEVFYFGALAG
jgi:hypothetical protein